MELAISLCNIDNLYLETSRVPGFETSKVIQKLGGDKLIMGGTVLSLLRKE